MYVVDTACSHFLWPSRHEHTRFEQHSYACFCCSCTAAYCSSSTRARTSMSIFPSMGYCTAKKKDTGPRSLDCSSATSRRQTSARHGQAVTGTGALRSSSNSIQRHSSNTRLEQHLYASCCSCFAAAYCSSMISSSACVLVLLQSQQEARKVKSLQLKIRRPGEVFKPPRGFSEVGPHPLSCLLGYVTLTM